MPPSARQGSRNGYPKTRSILEHCFRKLPVETVAQNGHKSPFVYGKRERSRGAVMGVLVEEQVCTKESLED